MFSQKRLAGEKVIHASRLSAPGGKPTAALPIAEALMTFSAASLQRTTRRTRFAVVCAAPKMKCVLISQRPRIAIL
ncbi:hypothetical protein AN219_37710 [Streptomyces nanshensis]|nr:hypothetical protein AN219_37710 [Streptomyces nanshensis]